MAAMLGFIILSLAGGAVAGAVELPPMPADCANGGIESANTDVAGAPREAFFQISGQARSANSGGVLVKFNGEPIGLLPRDANGGFSGSAMVPEYSSLGEGDLDLSVESCSDSQTMLVVGDSIAEGAFASSRETTFPSLVLNELSRRYGEGSWLPEVFGVPGYGSLLLDDALNSGLYHLNEPLFWARRWWKEADPDMVIIVVGVNNFAAGPGSGHDLSTRYDGTWRGYLTDEEAMAWWKIDVTGAVDYLISQKGVSPGHIMIMGQWPYGSSNPYGRGERYVGGSHEALWNLWNAEIQSYAQQLGCVFVPMADVFGPGYNPDGTKPEGDPDNYLDHAHDDQSIHPNDRGFAAFAARINSYLPPDLEDRRYHLPFTVQDDMAISLGFNDSTWASYEDYTAGVLTVSMSLTNAGTGNAHDSRITEAFATNGVIPVSEIPYSVGDLNVGESTNFDLRFLVPPGIMFFRTSLHAAASSDDGGVFEWPRQD